MEAAPTKSSCLTSRGGPVSRRLSENAHLPFDGPFDKLTVPSNVEGLTALSIAEGLRYPHPSSLRLTGLYASLLGISEALYLGIFHQPPEKPVIGQALRFI